MLLFEELEIAPHRRGRDAELGGHPADAYRAGLRESLEDQAEAFLLAHAAMVPQEVPVSVRNAALSRTMQQSLRAGKMLLCNRFGHNLRTNTGRPSKSSLNRRAGGEPRSSRASLGSRPRCPSTAPTSPSSAAARRSTSPRPTRRGARPGTGPHRCLRGLRVSRGARLQRRGGDLQVGHDVRGRGPARAPAASSASCFSRRSPTRRARAMPAG